MTFERRVAKKLDDPIGRVLERMWDATHQLRSRHPFRASIGVADNRFYIWRRGHGKPGVSDLQKTIIALVQYRDMLTEVIEEARTELHKIQWPYGKPNVPNPPKK